MTFWTLAFWQDAAERAVRAAAGAALGTIGADGLGLRAAGWEALGTTAGLAALASIFVSLVGSRVGDLGTASLLSARAGASGRHARG